MQTVLSSPTAFRSHPAIARRDMRPLGSTRHLRKDEALFRDGDRATHYYKVLSGTVRTFKLLADGRRQIDAFHFEGDVFGVEMGSDHRLDAEAACDALVVCYRNPGFHALITQGDDTAEEALSALMRSLERAQNHMLLLGRKSALEKIAAFLLELAERSGGSDLDVPMCRMDIADHLGLTIETVSRTLTQLERQGVIEVPAGRRGITLRDRTALEDLNA